ncbi:alpha/beta hydrolase [Asticcacaulis solisilvae]|uniref:alpha/beta hydrolase n=1 Tax=Asticcacaulis solisilvae TaxID=1217274 RepID=UPI003FD8CE6B
MPYQRTARAVMASLCLFAPALTAPAMAEPWAAPAGYKQIEIWPAGTDIKTPDATGPETVSVSTSPKLGKVTAVQNVTRPTMSIYPPKGKNTGATIVVFPGGGYQILAIDLEGTDVCDWATQKGITCVVLKYRVPDSGPHWDKACNCAVMPPVNLALQDAQRTIGLLRQHAKQYHIDPDRIGVLGFSAGGTWSPRSARIPSAPIPQSTPPTG